MKITKPGKISQHKSVSPLVGATGTCPQCGTQFEIEPTDTQRVVEVKDHHDKVLKRYIGCPTPGCEANVPLQLPKQS